MSRKIVSIIPILKSITWYYYQSHRSVIPLGVLPKNMAPNASPIKKKEKRLYTLFIFCELMTII